MFHTPPEERNPKGVARPASWHSHSIHGLLRLTWFSFVPSIIRDRKYPISLLASLHCRHRHVCPESALQTGRRLSHINGDCRKCRGGCRRFCGSTAAVCRSGRRRVHVSLWPKDGTSPRIVRQPPRHLRQPPRYPAAVPSWRSAIGANAWFLLGNVISISAWISPDHPRSCRSGSPVHSGTGAFLRSHPRRLEERAAR
jgi:hypothetical protein